ncbi:endolytic transglycosylase MltG [Bacillus sp. EB600]|uniref:endolytic transglycosylase MltG n=1 Tax=Bacillus sp. EB600 TaxID=2806345 RepID=UPI00210BD04D|nr:endolytic transglycosylase MltG [Bacillus sp. EB600]MCQ6282160.1 aminodeoxychorismate lyase [Bacillus sp. EB600]
MRFNLLSSFAAGIFIATSISSAVYLSNNSDTPKGSVKSTEIQTNVKVQPSEKEMKDKLVSAGYIVQTKADYDNALKDAKGSVQKESAQVDDKSNKNVTRVILNVTDGMTSIDVGRALETAKIVPNAFNFSKDIESKGLENSLRPGVFEVDSGMSYDQVISTIFKK